MKLKRHSKIIELININDIETQEDLAELLNSFGFDVTQATISRDIRELMLTKISTPDGKQKYAVQSSTDTYISERLIRIFKDGVISMNYAQNILVVKTLVGMAMAVAAAIDAMDYSDIIGSIAGDDTIFCVVRSEQHALTLMEKLNTVMNME